MLPGRLAGIVRRGNVARGEGRDSQRRVGEAREEPAKLRRGLHGRVGRGRAALVSPWYASVWPRLTCSSAYQNTS